MCRRQSTPPALPLYMTHMWLFNTLHLPQLPTPYSFVFDFGLRGTTICNWINNVLWRYIVKPCPALPYQDFTSFEVERFSLLSRLSITQVLTSLWKPVKAIGSLTLGIFSLCFNRSNHLQRLESPKGRVHNKTRAIARVYRLLTD